MTVYESLLRKIVFRMDPEFAHRATVRLGCIAQSMPLGFHRVLKRYAVEDERLHINVAGVRFDNPIGLAAGWDKNGHVVPALSQLGFGHVEVGSVSADPSSGNPKPRLARLVDDQAILVHYGLPNDGAEIVAQRLSSIDPADRSPSCRLGINVVSTNRVGAEKVDSAQDIFQDYFHSVTQLHPIADYLMLNLSCPNTEDGVDFFCVPGNVQRLLEILRPMELKCPVFLKVPPNPEPSYLDGLLSEVDGFGFVKGFEFNLTPGHPEWMHLKTAKSVWKGRPGAVAGPPVKRWHDRCVQQLFARMPTDRYQIISAGGISSAEDAYQRIKLGASLVQLYSALIYQGPSVIHRVNSGLLGLLERDGLDNIAQAVGTSNS